MYFQLSQGHFFSFFSRKLQSNGSFGHCVCGPSPPSSHSALGLGTGAHGGQLWIFPQGVPEWHLMLCCVFKSPPATGLRASGHPGWRSGNARARCAGLRTPLGSCAARVRRAAESAAAPVADHGRVRDGWCYEHQCHRAPSHGRLRHARQPQMRQGASSTVTRP